MNSLNMDCVARHSESVKESSKKPIVDNIYYEYGYLQAYTEMLLELSIKAISNIEKASIKEDLISEYNLICNGLEGKVKNLQEIEEEYTENVIEEAEKAISDFEKTLKAWGCANSLKEQKDTKDSKASATGKENIFSHLKDVVDVGIDTVKQSGLDDSVKMNYEKLQDIAKKFENNDK